MNLCNINFSNSRRATLADIQTQVNLVKDSESREFEIGKSFLSVLIGDKNPFVSRHRLSLPHTKPFNKKSSIDLNDVSALVENATKIRVKRNSLPAQFINAENQAQENQAASSRKTSLVNPSESQKSRHNSTIFQYSPYMFRKLSMSHAKVRCRV